MLHHVIRSTELDLGLRAEWLRIQRASRTLASPYFSPELTEIVGRAGEEVRVTVLEDGGRVVGFFPFQRGRFAKGIPVGGGLSDQHGVVVEDGADWNVADLLEKSALDFWPYDHLVASQTAFALHHRAMVASPALDLSRGFDAYLERRREAGARRVFETERKARKLAREIGPLRFEASTRDRHVFERVLELKAEQCRRTGADDFLARPHVRGIIERIVATESSHFAGFVSALWAGDRLVAAHVGMRSDRVWHWWFPVYERELGNYSPGAILLLRSAAHAASLGMELLDLGKGDESYKASFADTEIALAEGCATRPSLGASLYRLERAARRAARAVISRTDGLLSTPARPERARETPDSAAP